ncbi:protein of unknown function [Candidatus Filomicrobium marinum]|uniref:Uncharacterized protein n=1 Tax=Candidatus Filomicrobium marinum TaxID=1608628 RepID=A0A0D6JB56_9HYPH|nr:protein of unknown function [Candidatus Filomicrobium marinum]CPR16220.1 protein of unknown function [Candidatus Filomicrobium marinum]
MFWEGRLVRSGHPREEAALVIRGKLAGKRRHEVFGRFMDKRGVPIVIARRGEQANVEAVAGGDLLQLLGGCNTRGAMVMGDVKALQPGWRDEEGEMVGAGGGGNGHRGHEGTHGEHGFQALADCHHVLGVADADGMADEVAQGAFGLVDAGFAGPVGSKVEALHAGDDAGVVGDGGNDGRKRDPVALVGDVIAARMKA